MPVAFDWQAAACVATLQTRALLSGRPAVAANANTGPLNPGKNGTVTLGSRMDRRAWLLVIVMVLPLHPHLVLRSTRLTGGDFDGHVWTPWFLRHFVGLRTLGFGTAGQWTDHWFTGFPVLRFYFPVPAWIVAVLSSVVDPDIAFKLVVLSTIVAIPLLVRRFGIELGLSRDVALCLCAGAVAWQLDPQYEILGGNILSTFAGEYSYAMSVAISFVFLRLHVRSLRTAGWSFGPGLVLAISMLTHVFPAATSVVIAVAWTLWSGRGGFGRRVAQTVLSGVVAFLLAAWWLVPFLIDAPRSMIDIGWERTTDVTGLLFPIVGGRTGWVAFSVAQVLAVVAIASSFRSTRTEDVHLVRALLSSAVVGALVVALVPEGRLWNERMLPCWVMCCWLLAGLGASQILRLATRPNPAVLPPVGLAVLTLALTQTGVLSSFRPETAWGDAATVSRTAFRGWEGRQTAQEVRELVDRLDALGSGVVLTDWTSSWAETAGELWMATLPIQSHGRIRSAEGVLYESSGSLPFLLTAQQYLSEEVVGSIRGVPEVFDPATGALLARDLGVRYLVLRSAKATAEVRRAPGTTLRGTVGGFSIVELAPVPIAEVLTHDPVVIRQLGGTQEQGWIDVAMATWLDSMAASAPATDSTHAWGLAVADGPAAWRRVSTTVRRRESVTEAFGSTVEFDEDRAGPPTAGSGSPTPQRDPGTVEVVSEHPQAYEFRTSEPGAPVRIRVPWSPRWKATGASGAWRAGPNHLVVVPTGERFGIRIVRPAWESAVRSLSLLTLVSLGLIGVRRTARRRSRPGSPMRDDAS